ncbi:hypothetical protein [Novilysobacter arseniciresistens]|uniref:hypothetical protein n=1 Tax=Novilysobacter arseniciresistens TaxID=1385522 RepID=UPI00126A1F2D|nr:hypothetical protein [Lysobacter arseniciresistens]
MLVNSAGMLIFCAIASLYFAASPPANAQSVKVESSVSTTYQAGSRESSEVRGWLIDHAEYRNGTPLGEFEKLGQIVVTYETSHPGSGVTASSPGNQPPVPLPATGRHGDTITISSCGGGASQSWSYTWVANPNGGGWVLISYSYTRTRACSGSGA